MCINIPAELEDVERRQAGERQGLKLRRCESEYGLLDVPYGTTERRSMLRQKPQWKWVVSLVIATVCGVVASASAQVITACPAGKKLASVPATSNTFTSSQSIRLDFLDNNPNQLSWKLIARAKNAGSSSASYQLTVNLAGNTCAAGPTSLSPGAIGTKNCNIVPEYTPTGRYTMLATASGVFEPAMAI